MEHWEDKDFEFTLRLIILLTQTLPEIIYSVVFGPLVLLDALLKPEG